MLGLKQIEAILKQVSKNILMYIGVNLGEAVLSEADRALLTSMGIEVANLGGEFPNYYKMYLLGRLTQLVGDYNAHQIEYADFEAYLRKKQFQPLTDFEQIQYELARQATYGHLKNLENRVRMDVNGVIMNTISRVEYEDVIKREIERGVKERRAIGAIVSDIGHATGDWQKDLGRIVETEMNNIFQQGRAVQITRSNPDKDPLVYKDVYPGACRHCIRLYLTAGLGSKPRLFRLSQLRANGSNIGRKVSDWKATIAGVHPWCRCQLRDLQEGMIWDEDKKQFVYDDKELEREEKRLGIKGKVKVQVGDKVFVV